MKKKKMSMQSDIKTITEETTTEDVTTITEETEVEQTTSTLSPIEEVSKPLSTGAIQTEEEILTEETEEATPSKLSNKITKQINKDRSQKMCADTARNLGTQSKTVGH